MPNFFLKEKNYKYYTEGPAVFSAGPSVCVFEVLLTIGLDENTGKSKGSVGNRFYPALPHQTVLAVSRTRLRGGRPAPRTSHLALIPLPR